MSNRSAAMEEAVAKDHLLPSKVNTTRMSRHFLSPSTAGGIFPLRFAKDTHIVLPLLLL